jgi:hypothetical protein
MTKVGKDVLRSALLWFLGIGAMPAITLATDLSKYRDIQLGADLAAVAKQAGSSPTQAKVVYRRPVLIQELEWHPQPLGPSSRTESVKDVVFTFYEGKLFRIAIDYDPYETEGMTANDFVKAISAAYGTAETLAVPAKVAQTSEGNQEEVLARWQDPQYRFDLIRTSYGPSFRLLGILKTLEAPAQAAIKEGIRLDDQEAPQRDAARIASENEVERARLEKARLINAPNFRP